MLFSLCECVLAQNCVTNTLFFEPLNPDLEHFILIKPWNADVSINAGEMLKLIWLKVIKTHFISPDTCHKCRRDSCSVFTFDLELWSKPIWAVFRPCQSFGRRKNVSLQIMRNNKQHQSSHLRLKTRDVLFLAI